MKRAQKENIDFLNCWCVGELGFIGFVQIIKQSLIPAMSAHLRSIFPA